VVVLKPLRLARRDGDTVYALVTGSAVNNDGAAKLSYTAPGLAGQREVIRSALRRSGRTAADLGYVEAHGTGTELGDPVEVGALHQAYGLAGGGDIALASVKSQIGHLGAAAGVVGLVRATLAVHHGRIPPNIDFHQLNPRIGADIAPFSIPAKARPWPAGRPRVAAVSSFGIGGTNAHVVIEAAEPVAAPAADLPCLMISAASTAALRADAALIADYVAAHQESYLQVLRHLQAGRPSYRFRAAAACPDATAAVAWLRTAAPVAVTPAEDERAVNGATAADLAAAWLAGAAIGWPAGPAQAPWDFPPPAFALADYDFTRAAPRAAAAPGAAAARGPWPPRRSESDWMHQPQWVRWRRAAPGVGSRAPAVLVVMAAGETDPAVLRPFQARYARVVRVAVADAFGRVDEDAYQVDPADPDSLKQLLDAVTGPGAGSVDWLHALPLAVDGPVGAGTLARARWASLDTPAALLRAAGDWPHMPVLRTWWMSHRTQPVDGPVDRPELGLLAGIAEVGPQECAVDGHWLDLPSPDPADWAAPVAGLLDAAGPAGPAPLPRRLALRQRYWWRQVLLPLAGPDTGPGLPAGPGVHLILGGTGGIGATIAAWLLEHGDGRVVLLARRPHLPPGLARWADRVETIPADLAAEPVELVADRIGRAVDRLDSVVHAAGIGAGGLIVRRDAATATAATAAKLNGALLVERLVARYRPALALYCSSMSAQLGGVGQLDYAAANGALDGFAAYCADDGETTLRLSIDWDVWREAGMARESLPDNARHQAHLAVGLTLDEARRVLDRALRRQLPHVLVSTTDIERSAVFYAPAAAQPGPAAETPPPETPTAETPVVTMAEHLAGCLRRWLQLDDLDAAASLYDLGADSLVLIDLVAEVKDRTGTDLMLSRLSHRVSLAEVLALLAEADTASGEADGPESPAVDPVTVEVWQEGNGSTVLCLVHPVGGDLAAYRPLVSALDDRLTVCLIADPALHRPELPAWSIAERARRYHAALQVRFPPGQWRWRLAGWSFGAWVAVAMAVEAEAAGRPAGEVYLLDPPPPDAGPRLAAYDDAQLDTVFAHELAHGGGVDRVGSEARAYAERLARCGRANLASMAAYTPPALAVTPARLWLAGRPTAGLPALEPPEARARRWRAHLPGLAGWQALDTTHDGVVRPPYVQAVADAISAASLPVLTVG
jgi:thioesterase domain-containing protein/acyl carrier protein